MPSACLEPEDDERSVERAVIAVALASMVVYKRWTAFASNSMVDLRSSPMLLAQEDAGDGCWIGGGVGGSAAGARKEEDRRDRDTRLSRASNP